MAMAHFDVSLAYDQIVKRGVPGQVARVSDADTDLPYVELLDLDGNPLAALVSNSQGYVPPFQIQDGPALVKMSVGGVTYYLQDLNLFGETAQAAQQAAADAQKAAQLVEAPADEVVKTLIEGPTLSQTAGDARWLTRNSTDQSVADLLIDGQTQSAGAMLELIAESAPTADGLITASERARAKHPASHAILDLARADGWAAVYDPANSDTLTLDEDGNVLEIHDGLGNAPSFITDSDIKPTLVLEPFAQMRGGTIHTQGDFGLTATYGAMLVADTPIITGGANQYVLSGNGSEKRLTFGLQSSTEFFRIGNGVATVGSRKNEPGRHVLDVKVNGTETEFSVDGHYGSRGTASGNPLGIPDSFRLGGFGLISGAPTNAWQGTWGIFLLHPDPSPEVMNRMRKLVMQAVEVKPGTPDYWPETRSLTIDGTGNIVVCNGDPDLIMGSSIMSITKTITALTAREFLTTDALLDQTFDIVEDDAYYWGTESVFQVGDEVTFRDLLYAAALPSNDLAPRAIARRVAELYIPGSEPAVKRFLKKLNENLALWGYHGANASAVGGGGKLSLRQTADVIRRMTEDATLRGIWGTRTKTLDIQGPNARTVNLRHTIDAGTAASYPFVEFIAGKTGTGRGRQNVAVAWTHPDGGEYITVVLSVLQAESSHNRYVEMYKGIFAAKNDEQYINLATNAASGVPENSTSTLDVTDIFTGISRTSYSNSGVYLVRTGTTVMLSFYDVAISDAGYSILSLLGTGYTPQMAVFGTATDSNSGAACIIRVSGYGSVQIGNPADAVIRGSITYPVMPTDDFPAPPFPGFHWQRV